MSHLLEEMARGGRVLESYSGGQMPGGFTGKPKYPSQNLYKGDPKFGGKGDFKHKSKEAAVADMSDQMFQLMRASISLTGYKEFRAVRKMIDQLNRQWKKDRDK